MGLLSPYGLMWNLAGSVFMGCFSFVGSLVFIRILLCEPVSCLLDFVVQVGRGRHSGNEWDY